MTQFAERLRIEFGPLLATDRRLRKQAARLLESALLPRRRPPGRPVTYPEVAQAYRMMNELHREHPRVPYRNLWKIIYPATIAGYDQLNKPEKRAARHNLRERVRWRRRDRKRALRRAGTVQP